MANEAWHRVYCAVCGGHGIQCTEPAGEPRSPDGRRASICKRCLDFVRASYGPVTPSWLLGRRLFLENLSRDFYRSRGH